MNIMNDMNNQFNDMLFNFNHMNNMNNMNHMDNFNNNINELDNPYDGYIKGNMFVNLYKPYKNYRPIRLVPNNEQAEMLLEVNKLEFASHEIRLYLDNFPNDQKMISKFNEYRKMTNEAIDRYQRKYGPLLESDLSNPNLFSWQATPWPWEMEGR